MKIMDIKVIYMEDVIDEIRDELLVEDERFNEVMSISNTIVTNIKQYL
jgi:hypothetical protein